MESNPIDHAGLRWQTVTDFAKLAASDAPFPGGGGVAALTGALAAALCSMVCNLTVGRKKYAAVEGDIRAALAQAERLREKLLALIDEDAVCFGPLAKAYAIPKHDPARGAVMEQALHTACTAPMDMMRCCCEVVELLETLLEKGSAMLVSDVGVGAELARAALVSSSMNVFINTGSMRDAAVRQALEQEADGMLIAFIPRAEAVVLDVQKRIRKGA